MAIQELSFEQTKIVAGGGFFSSLSPDVVGATFGVFGGFNAGLYNAAASFINENLISTIVSPLTIASNALTGLSTAISVLAGALSSIGDAVSNNFALVEFPPSV
ncbi:hypothetical protein LOC54_10205 [Acetobacter sp. AN02]|uniref:hypothetical protein n=1 Tax=Acetobacter sp. AN02 TaxID=2894186 RepID=UPI002434661B|nr:hypothetical protein [Acetobacter sp. AN02]MDG6095469.1 hypothetical protein [Acetobacter sp. AN02]